MTRQVLVVDDDLVNRKLARAMLARDGWEVSECEDGPSALEQVRQQPFDAVLLDISLPGMSGETVCERLREAHPGLFIVAYTAHTMPEDTERMLAGGFDRVLLKPVTFAALRTAFATQQAY
ncbi:response regulator [Paraburkholderia bonniea]|uniref:response regulator n=1 Tax=Paraburkholderia bonniea TaxID=2152891 RepID=UPI0012914094|nr:response regulator [Paraburkholderia bonniea]WJF91716.1 response regulator [Paraburkholderia bonniea]WJF95036.1 response regulator [Paraburkholderia bonniea]